MAIDVSWLPAPLQSTAKLVACLFAAAVTLMGSGWFVSDRVGAVVKRIDILEINIKNRYDLAKVETSYQIYTIEARVARLEGKRGHTP